MDTTRSSKKTTTKPCKKTTTKPCKKTTTKPCKKTTVKKTTVKKTTKPVKKTTVKKTTKPVKKTTKKTGARSLSSLFTSPSGECNNGSSRGPSGKCEQLPCFDNTGSIVSGGSRGADGSCRLPECGRGTIVNPATGKCVGVNSEIGKSLLPYMYEVKARVARAKADRFASLAPHASDGYNGMYKALSERRVSQMDLARSADETTSRIKEEKRARVMKKMEERAAYLRAKFV